MCFQNICALLTATGTIAVAIAAIWGDYFRSKMFAPKLSLESCNLHGSLTNRANGQRTIYYNLKVCNYGWAPGKNCKVMLVGLHRKGPDGNFHAVSLIVPQQFCWSPSEFSPILNTVVHSNVVDLGFIDEAANRFSPALYYYSNNFSGFVGPDECVRYSIQIEAENYGISRIYVYEVSWNGRWSSNLDEMNQYLIIKSITQVE